MHLPVPNQDLDFKRLISWSFYVQWVQLRWQIIVHFVDMFSIDDHHCLNFLFIIWNLMLSAGIYFKSLEVHVHNEQWSFVNGGAEVCSIVVCIISYECTIVCQRPVKGRYVSVTVGGSVVPYWIYRMTIYSKCKYICSFQCWDLLWIQFYDNIFRHLLLYRLYLSYSDAILKVMQYRLWLCGQIKVDILL